MRTLGQQLEISRHNPEGRRKLALWKKDPHCFWCGKLTVVWKPVDGAAMPPNTATLDHLQSRNRGRLRCRRLGLKATVLACHNCNRARGAIEGKALNGVVDGQLIAFIVAAGARPDNDKVLLNWLQFLKDTVAHAKSPKILLHK